MEDKNKDKFRVFIASYLILDQGGYYLLQKRKNTGYQDGNWGLVSGHMEGGETAKEAIIREAKEEVGIKLKEEDLDILHVMHYYRRDREYIAIFLKAKTWSGEIINQEPEKCEELKWFKCDALPENTIPEIRQVINCVNKAEFYSEHGWELRTSDKS